MSTCRWSPDGGFLGSSSTLIFSLSLATDYQSVRVSGTLGDTIFVPYDSDEGRMMPAQCRSGMTQCVSFQSAVRCIESVWRTPLFPAFVGKGSTSLHRLGFTGRISGLVRRPVMQRQEQTCTMVFDYLNAQTDKRFLRTLVPTSSSIPSIQLPTQHEPTAKDRYLEYKRIYARRRSG